MQTVATGQQLNLKSTQWIGLNLLNNNNVFQWSDGENVPFYNWAAGQPSNTNGIQYCVEMRTGQNWYDQNCYVKRGITCKIPKGVDPNDKPIVINDLFPGDKVYSFKIRANNYYLSLSIVTECENKGDSELNWVQYRNKCYYSSPYIESQYLSWQDADSFCKQEGGFLVSIHSLNELQFINSKV
jgi:hypothetical protein